ncbi:hypothetical protein ElyMa_004640700 [Elysia marginata]|uniref:Uncharacterized protein n=1 Tax=Elysia marginata TaxID=1093978 RepID=A0AAV4I2A2_9GAST|nr:hypothetical protein ElyMa_004640700 [Elysia marginata]
MLAPRETTIPSQLKLCYNVKRNFISAALKQAKDYHFTVTLSRLREENKEKMKSAIFIILLVTMATIQCSQALPEQDINKGIETRHQIEKRSANEELGAIDNFLGQLPAAFPTQR